MKASDELFSEGRDFASCLMDICTLEGALEEDRKKLVMR